MRITGTLREDIFTVIAMSCLISLRMRNISDKSCKENENAHFMCITFF
jgi:hypothetical protein